MFQSKIANTVLLLLLFSAFVVLPDQFYAMLNDHYRADQSIKVILVNLVLMMMLAFCRSPKLVKGCLLLFATLQTSQFMYFHYYGTFYSAFDIVLLQHESKDAMTGFFNVIYFMSGPFLCSAVLAISSLVVFSRVQYCRVTVPWLSVLIVLLLLVPLLQSVYKGSQHFQPKAVHNAMKNGFYALSYYLTHSVKRWSGEKPVTTQYQPYLTTTSTPVDANIVVIMGESLSYLHMGLFGYERETTPYLQQYAEHPAFIFQPSLSSAVSTRVSLALFFNTVYEPDNADHLDKKETSLFSLAKKAGFQTHYLSTQQNAAELTASFINGDIDTWKDHEQLSKHNSLYDERLLLELDALQLDYDQPQFITLHMRSAHTPYIDNYPPEQTFYPTEDQEYADFMRNSYDNSVRYTEKLITDIYRYFERTERPTYIFFTSDHGELLGQGGRFGHNQVDLDIGRVPFLFYGVGLPAQDITKLKDKLGCLPNHYMLSLQIAELLGYHIVNPNQQADIFYLNGTSAIGDAGYMPYSHQQEKAVACGMTP